MTGRSLVQIRSPQPLANGNYMKEKLDREPRKFHRGDRVRVYKSSSYIPEGRECLIIGSYAEVCNQHWHGDERSKHIYEVFILPNKGPLAWVDEQDMVLVEKASSASNKRLDVLMKLDD